MPRNPNNIQISLSSKYRSILSSLAQEGESIDLCAKRLLVECLDKLLSSDNDRFAQIEDRLKAIEESLLYGNGAAKRKTETKK
jgi:hypothetical protein